MSTIDSTHRGHIENILGRPLTDDELQAADSLDALTNDQIAIIAELRPKNTIAPRLYVNAVVPTAKHADVSEFVESIDEVYVTRFPPPELPNEPIFEQYAGRPLMPAERVRVENVYELSSSQIELAKLLAHKDVSIAFLYLSRVAPNESTEQRHYVAKHLAGLV
jgi:hypothetical protein